MKNKFLKRSFAFLMSVSIAAAAMPQLLMTEVSAKLQQSEYYFEDFETGLDANKDNWYKLALQGGNNGGVTRHTSSTAGGKGTSLALRSYDDSASASVRTLVNPNGDYKWDYNIPWSAFEGKMGEKLVLSYDLYLPNYTSGNAKQTVDVMLTSDGVNGKNGYNTFTRGGKITFNGSTRIASGFNQDTDAKKTLSGLLSAGHRTTGINITLPNTTDGSRGQWKKIKLVVDYTGDETTGTYTSRCYVDGELITMGSSNPTVVEYITNIDSTEIASMKNRTNLGFVITARCGATDETGNQDTGTGILLDNISYYTYSGTDIAKSATAVADVATVNVRNKKYTAVQYASAPTTVKEGFIDVSSATVTAEKYDGSDIFAINKENVTTLTLNNVSGGSAFEIKNVPTLADSDILNVTISGAKDIAGNTIDDFDVIVKNANATSTFLSTEIFDFSGATITPEKENAVYKLPITTNVLKFNTMDEADKTITMAKADGTGELVAVFADGVYTLTSPSLLAGGCEYVINRDRNEVIRFTTVEAAEEVSVGIDNSAAPEFNWINTYQTDKDVVFVSVGYNGSGKVVKGYIDEVTLDANMPGSFQTSNDMSGCASYEGFWFMKDAFDGATTDESIFKTTAMSYVGKANAKINLGSQNAGKTVDIIAANDNNVKYAKTATLDAEGKLTHSLTGIDEGVYTLYLQCEGVVYKYNANLQKAAYFYEDFEGFDGTSAGLGALGLQATSGYYTAEEYQGETAVALNRYDQNSSATLSPGSSYNFNIPWNDFEGSENKQLIFSYDMYLQDAKDARQTVNADLSFLSGSTYVKFTRGIKLSMQDASTRVMCGYAQNSVGKYDLTLGTNEANINIMACGHSVAATSYILPNATDGSGRQKVNVKMVVTYEKDANGAGTGQYTSIAYVNGELVKNGDNPIEFITKLTAADVTTMKARTKLGFEIAARCGLPANYSSGDQSGIYFDNISYGLYEGTEIAKLAGALYPDQAVYSARVDVYNTKYAAMPEVTMGLRGGNIDISEATVVATKYAGTDVFKTNGVVDEFVELEADTSSKTGASFVITEIAGMSADDVLEVVVQNAKDIVGNIIPEFIVIVKDENANIPFYRAEISDSFGKVVNPTAAQGGYTMPINTKEFVFYTTDDADLSMSIERADGQGTAINAVFDADKGTYTAAANTLLSGGVEYVIKKGGNDIVSFVAEVVENTVMFSVDSTSIPRFDWMNTFSESKDAVFVSVGYSADGSFSKGYKEVVSLTANSSNTFVTENDMSGCTSYEGFAFLKSDFDAATEKYEEFKVSAFDASSCADAYVKLGKTYKDKNVKIFAVDASGNNVVYAKAAQLDNHGEATVDANFAGKAGGSYTFYLQCEDVLYKFDKAYYAPSGVEAELLTLKSKTTAADMESYLSTNAGKLDLDYCVYEGLTNKTKVAQDLVNYLTANPSASKSDVVTAFQQFAVMQALKESKISDISAVKEDVPTLNEAPVSEWYGYRTDVTEARTESWSKTATANMSGADFSSIADFEKKLAISHMFAAINNKQSTDLLVSMMTAYASETDLDTTHLTAKAVSKLGTSYSGFDLSALESALETNDGLNDYTGTTNPETSTGGNLSFGGGGGNASSKDDNKDDDKTDEGNNETTEPGNTTPSGGFSDISDYKWAEAAIVNLTEKGIISGYGDGSFKPSNKINREEFVKLIVVAAGIEASGADTLSFDDVNADDWFYEFVAAAFENKIINGKSAAEFGVGESITREDMAVIILNMLTSQGIVLSDKNADFTDKDNVSDYAKEAVELLAGAKILNGYDDGTFKPRGNLNRAEAAMVINAILELLN